MLRIQAGEQEKSEKYFISSRVQYVRTVIRACKQHCIQKNKLCLKNGIMQSLDIALKGIKAVLIYYMCHEGGSSKVERHLGKKNTSGSYIWSEG